MINYIRATFIIGFVWLLAINITSPVFIEVDYIKKTQDLPETETMTNSEVRKLFDDMFADFHENIPSTICAGLLMFLAWLTEIIYLRYRSNKALDPTPES